MKSAGHIYLVGFMGSGKSTVGPLLAGRLGRRFLDLDRLIEADAGATIPEIFEADGEAGFRHLESVCLDRVSRRPSAVVALGGGAFEDPRNREVLSATGLTIWLQVSLASARERALGDSRRPLARDPAAFEALYQRRRQSYAQADWAVETEGRSPVSVCEEILRHLAAPGS